MCHKQRGLRAYHLCSKSSSVVVFIISRLRLYISHCVFVYLRMLIFSFYGLVLELLELFFFVANSEVRKINDNFRIQMAKLELIQMELFYQCVKSGEFQVLTN